MRDKLNDNPLLQVAIIGVLLVGAAFFVFSSSGGEEEAAEPTTEATVSVTGTEATGTATGATPGEAVEGAVEAAGAASVSQALSAVSQAGVDLPPPPRPVREAYVANRTVVLLFVRDGGIDDRQVKLATEALSGFSDASTFIVPAAEISRYASITQGVGVDRVPALVVVSPKDLKKVVPTASVGYGFQSHDSIAQAVIDAGYEGPTVDYHP
jgi:hypothetical protein